MINVLSLQTLPAVNNATDACSSAVSCTSSASCVSRRSKALAAF